MGITISSCWTWKYLDIYLKNCWHFLQLVTGLHCCCYDRRNRFYRMLESIFSSSPTHVSHGKIRICIIAANRCFSKLNFFCVTALWNNFTSGNCQDDFICFYGFFSFSVQTHFLLQVRLMGLRPLEWIQPNEIQIHPLNSWTDSDVHNYGGSRRIYSTFIGHIRDSFQHFSLQTRWLTASFCR